jgi:hypothetical protein
MKLLSFELPGFSGVERGCGRVGVTVEAVVAVEAGGDGRVGWRNPPGSGASDVDAMVWRVEWGRDMGDGWTSGMGRWSRGWYHLGSKERCQQLSTLSMLAQETRGQCNLMVSRRSLWAASSKDDVIGTSL